MLLPEPPDAHGYCDDLKNNGRNQDDYHVQDSFTTSGDLYQISYVIDLWFSSAFELTVIAACATPVPSLTPTIPYGLANQAGVLESQNTLYPLDSPAGTLEGCCNLCYFGLPNCIQTFFHFYEGCVIQQGTSVTGARQGVSNVCPNGKISGLTYNPDTNPPLRSTGDIAGPCAQLYNDL